MLFRSELTPVSVAVIILCASLIAEFASDSEDDSFEDKIPELTRLIKSNPIMVTKIVETIKVVEIILRLKDLFQDCLIFRKNFTDQPCSPHLELS